MSEAVATPAGQGKERKFGAWWGVGLFGILLVGSLVGNVIGGMAYGIYIAATRGKEALQALSSGQVSPAGTTLIVVCGLLVGAGLFFVFSHWRARHLLRDGSAGGIGWVPATKQAGMAAVLAGVLMTAIAVGTLFWFPVDLSTLSGPLAIMQQGGFWVQTVLVVIAVVYAPVVEEYMFRGVLFSAFQRSWGTWPAAVVVTLLFTGMHAADKLDYLPGFALVFLLAAGTMFLRLRYRSLVPAIAMHFVYNLALVIIEATGIVPTL